MRVEEEAEEESEEENEGAEEETEKKDSFYSSYNEAMQGDGKVWKYNLASDVEILKVKNLWEKC